MITLFVALTGDGWINMKNDVGIEPPMCTTQEEVDAMRQVCGVGCFCLLSLPLPLPLSLSLLLPLPLLLSVFLPLPLPLPPSLSLSEAVYAVRQEHMEKYGRVFFSDPQMDVSDCGSRVGSTLYFDLFYFLGFQFLRSLFIAGMCLPVCVCLSLRLCVCLSVCVFV